MIFSTLRGKIFLGVAIPLLLMVLLGGVVLANIRAVVDSNRKVNVSHERVIAVQELLVAVEEMATGGRGYLLSGREDIFQSYQEAKKDAFAHLSTLGERVADSPEQLLRLREVEELMHSWLREEVDPLIALRRGGGEGMAEMGKLSGETGGEKYSGRVRAIIKEFVAAEGQGNVFQEKKLEAAVASTYASVYGCVLLALTVGLLLAAWTGETVLRQVGGEPGEIARIAAEVAGGNLRVVFAPGRKTGIVAALAHMVVMLREQTAEIVDGANSLAAAISEISVTMSQFAASAAQSSTTISEVATTVEEVRHTVDLTNEKSRRMVADSHELAVVAREGGEASAAALAGMVKINEEMEYIAESTVKLSEQTQNIGEIISSVNELTDQSNLLSVNATIEAAKAGEVGKGFGVVAQEVRSLAEQAREATAQIKTILNEIEKATGAAVMATERGSKSVESGAKLSRVAGQAITVFQECVDTFATSAELIGASSQQQLAGMEQVVGAMEIIKAFTMQNVNGARQLEEAVRAIATVGKRLQENVSRFKV